MQPENPEIRSCKVCNTRFGGRSDKQFCSDECRVYFNNLKNRERVHLYNKDRVIQTLNSSVKALYQADARFLLKIVLSVAQLCKIISTFGFSKKQRDL